MEEILIPAIVNDLFICRFQGLNKQVFDEVWWFHLLKKETLLDYDICTTNHNI